MTEKMHERREQVFWVLAGIFLSAMTLLNVIGITKFIDIGGLTVAVGVLPYPLTFLCTDLISELYGKKRANFLVWLGLFINLFVLSVIALGEYLPAVGTELQPPWQTLSLAKEVYFADGTRAAGEVSLFSFIYHSTAGAVLASMFAYVLAQFCDVQLFHFWKRVTNGKHLWLRNNMSTLASQLVDSIAVISITFGATYMRGDMTLSVIMGLLFSNYLFKLVAALLDTPLFYFFTGFLRKYLDLEVETYP